MLAVLAAGIGIELSSGAAIGIELTYVTGGSGSPPVVWLHGPTGARGVSETAHNRCSPLTGRSSPRPAARVERVERVERA